MNDQHDWLIARLLNSSASGEAAGEEVDIRQTLLQFLEVLDSLDRLVAIATAAGEQSQVETPDWFNQLQFVRKQLVKAFERNGVVFFNCVGQSFDPGRHKAVEVIKRHALDNDTVVEEITRGCNWQGELLRFAQVVVAQKTDE